MRNVLTVGTLVLGVLGASHVAARDPAPSPEAALRETVREWIVRAYRNELGVVPGTRRANAMSQAPAGANIGHTFYFSLAGTPYETKPSIAGTYQYYIDDDDSHVGTVTLTITVPAYDVVAMGKTVVEAGKALELDMSSDDEDPHTYWDIPDGGRSLWVALGRGVVVLEMDHPDEPAPKATTDR
jgi:hypothetical protein